MEAVDISEKMKYQQEEETESSISETSTFIYKPRFIKPQRRSWMPLLRVGVEAAMAGVIVMLVATVILYERSLPSESLRKYGPPLPERVVIFGDDYHFGPDLVYAAPEMFYNETLLSDIYDNWQHLFPKGRGFVTLKDEDSFIVDHPPYDLSALDTTGENPHGWAMSVYHSLHCLLSLVESFGMSRDDFRHKHEAYLEHRAHCVEYLRQAILCGADTSIEGNPAAEFGTGPGIQNKHRHVCKDYDSLYKMASERAPWDVTEDLLSRVKGLGN